MTVTDGHSAHASCSMATRSSGVNSAFLLTLRPDRHHDRVVELGGPADDVEVTDG